MYSVLMHANCNNSGSIIISTYIWIIRKRHHIHLQNTPTPKLGVEVCFKNYAFAYQPFLCGPIMLIIPRVWSTYYLYATKYISSHTHAHFTHTHIHKHSHIYPMHIHFPIFRITPHAIVLWDSLARLYPLSAYLCVHFSIVNIRINCCTINYAKVDIIINNNPKFPGSVCIFTLLCVHSNNNNSKKHHCPIKYYCVNICRATLLIIVFV